MDKVGRNSANSARKSAFQLAKLHAEFWSDLLKTNKDIASEFAKFYKSLCTVGTNVWKFSQLWGAMFSLA